MSLNKYGFIKFLFIINCIIFLLISPNEFQDNWNKYKYNPVLGNNETGTVFDPFILKYKGLYQMYVSWRPKKSIALSTSKDGIHWSNLKIVLNNGNSDSWERIVNRASQNKDKSKIGLAISNNGYDFFKYKNNPILKAEYKYEKNSVMNPHVIFDKEEKIFKMWYSAGEIVEPDVICYATSKDGIHWKKYDKNPIFTPNINKKSLDFFKIGGCDVHKISNKKYIMFYIGYTDINTARIFITTSKDGINNWKRLNNPIIKPNKGQFDSNACYKPSAFFDKNNNRWMIWYNGRNENKELIGLAVHKIYKIFNFNNIIKKFKLIP